MNTICTALNSSPLQAVPTSKNSHEVKVSPEVPTITKKHNEVEIYSNKVENSGNLEEGLSSNQQSKQLNFKIKLHG